MNNTFKVDATRATLDSLDVAASEVVHFGAPVYTLRRAGAAPGAGGQPAPDDRKPCPRQVLHRYIHRRQIPNGAYLLAEVRRLTPGP